MNYTLNNANVTLSNNNQTSYKIQVSVVKTFQTTEDLNKALLEAALNSMHAVVLNTHSAVFYELRDVETKVQLKG